MKPLDLDLDLWTLFGNFLTSNVTFTDVRKIGSNIVLSAENKDKEVFSHTARCHKVYVVGVDTVKYSERSTMAQLVITGSLFSRIQSSVYFLRKKKYIPKGQPSIAIPLGDGAMFVFDDSDFGLIHALSFLFYLNMQIENMNGKNSCYLTQKSFNRSRKYPVLPVKCRIVLNTGEIFYMKDFNRSKNAIGEALVCNTRISGSSKGSHLLIHGQAMREINGKGGLLNIRLNKRQLLWKNLKISKSLKVKAKSATNRVHNIVGSYSASSFPESQKSRNIAADLIYDIGDSDLSNICM